MRKKRADDDDVVMQGSDGRVTPEDVQSAEFRLSFRGYNERDVDAFLDRITTDLSAYLTELAELRGGAPVLAMGGGGDTTAAENEAQQILGRAREQAAAIVRQAEQQAAAIRAGAGAGTGGDTRTAVAPFLNTEREFLQQLGTLVQTHAEEIKQMVLALRSREPASAAQAAPSGAAPAPPTPSPSQAAGSSDDVGGASAAEMRVRMGSPEPPPPSDRTVTLDSGTEPAFSSEGAPAGDPRERSLRELFWGED